MKAMILAAGRGERMRPLTDTVPKPLLMVGEEPLIALHLKRLKARGIVDIVINTSHLGEKIQDALGDGSDYGVSIVYSHEPVRLETGGGIKNALPLLGDAPFWVVNGDVLSDFDYDFALKTCDCMHLLMVNNPVHHPEGDFSLEGQRLQVRAHSSLTYSGIGLYRPQLFESFMGQSHFRLAEVIHDAIRQGCAAASRHSGQWIDVGTKERLEEARTLIRSGLF